MFDLNHLRCFVAVAEELHFRRAAARLNLSDQPLSRQIQLLEQILETRLLERNSRSVSLTQSGRWLLPEARRIMDMVEAATQQVRQVAGGQRGLLRVAFTAGAAYGVLPALVSRMVDAWPDIAFELVEMVTQAQVEALLGDRVDVGLMRPPFGAPELATRAWRASACWSPCRGENPLAAHDRLTPHDLAGQPFIHYAEREARYLHEAVAGIFARAGTAPRVVHQLAQIHSIMALVNGGIGCAVVPESARRLHYQAVVLRPLELREPAEVELVLAWRRQQPNPLVERLVSNALH